MARITATLASALTLVIVLTSCANTDTVTLTPPSPGHLPAPNHVEVITIGKHAPPDVTSPDAKRYYREGFRHMRDAEWFYAVAA